MPFFPNVDTVVIEGGRFEEIRGSVNRYNGDTYYGGPGDASGNFPVSFDKLSGEGAAVMKKLKSVKEQKYNLATASSARISSTLSGMGDKLDPEQERALQEATAAIFGKAFPASSLSLSQLLKPGGSVVNIRGKVNEFTVDKDGSPRLPSSVLEEGYAQWGSRWGGSYSGPQPNSAPHISTDAQFDEEKREPQNSVGGVHDDREEPMGNGKDQR